MKYITKFDNHSYYETFIASEDYITPNVSICVQQNEIHYNPYVHDYSQDYLTFEALEDGTFQFTNAINYSVDNGTTWTSLAANTATPIITSGIMIMWKAELTPSSSYPYGIGTFSSTGNFNIEGNAMSILFGDNFIGQTDLTSKNRALQNLFSSCSKLISAKNLSLHATTLADYCYVGMFNSCTNLTTAPQLPAMTLAQGCYANMFANCTSLTTAPQLPATTLAQSCYQYMFANCTSLTTAPELSAMTLANHCYNNMFNGCTNLTTLSQLPATTLAQSCYQQMFNGCTNLTTAPQLPATTLANSCYYNMFGGCTSLTTAPELPATTLAQACYASMFSSCTSLNYIKAMFTATPSTTYTTNWVKNVAATGTFVKNSAAEWDVTGVNGVPEGWTVQTAAA